MEIVEEIKSCGGSKAVSEGDDHKPLPLLSLNHISILCRSVRTSVRFYEDILGFVLIKRPSSFDFPGAWLFNYGIGIHLLESPTEDEYDHINHPRPINPKDNHISFQCSDVGIVKRKLKEWGMKYVTAVVEEGGMKVDQVFFHDPDGYMIEICNCGILPVVPFPYKLSTTTTTTNTASSSSTSLSAPKCGFMENVMMENLSLDMINLSF